MNRYEEYQNLCEALTNSPSELEYTMTRARAKYRRYKKHRFIKIPLSVAGTCMLFFVLLVNLSSSFALACSKLPVIGDLAEIVQIAPGLEAAVEHDYIQMIGQEQSQNGITMTIEYAIVDKKQINIFYRLTSAEHPNLSEYISVYDPQETTPVPGYMICYGRDQDGDLTKPELRRLIIEYTKDTTPSKLDLAATVSENEEVLAEFLFSLEFDPAYTAAGETIAVNQTVEMDGLTFTIASAELYPTHFRIIVDDNEDSSAWLKSLDFYLKDEAGNIYKEITNGISAIRSPDSPAMSSFHLNSAYFADSKHLSLCITGAGYLDKSAQAVRLYLTEGRAEALPDGVTLLKTVKNTQGWHCTFQVEYRRPGAMNSLFDPACYDEEGTAFPVGPITVKSGLFDDTGERLVPENSYFLEFLLEGYEEDVVLLSPSYTGWHAFPAPVEIPIK